MATITEHPKSGEGDRRGVGIFSASRLFIVHMDAVDDDPTALVEASYPRGSSHPQAAFSALGIVDYMREENLEYQARLALVRVTYGLPLVVLAEQWKISYHAATEFTEIVRDLDNRLIGGRAFARLKDTQGATHQADTIAPDSEDGGFINETVFLAAHPNAVNPKPLFAYGKILGMTMRRRVGNVTNQTITQLIQYLGAVNRERDFFGFNPGQCLMLNAEIEPEAGETSEQFEGGISYDVTLEFLGRPDMWTPQRIYDTYENDFYEFQVTNRTGPLLGEPSYQDFRIYNDVIMRDVLSLFAAPPPRLGGGGR